jgi:hypothetical protein
MLFLKNLLMEVGVLKSYERMRQGVEQRFFWYIFDERLQRHTPVIVYQMGKVGSTSLYYSLKKSYPGIVLHSHSFASSDNDWRIRELYKHCLANGRPLNIISLTREPIERNISAFFQNFERDTGIPYRRDIFSLEELKELFLKNYNHDIPLDWFDSHIKANFGIDVYASPFPECGSSTYSNGNIRILILRSEIDDADKTEVIKEFLDLLEFQMISKNVSSKKAYAETYRIFRETVRLPSSYISRMCNSRYFNHFYTEEFVESVRKKWSRE